MFFELSKFLNFFLSPITWIILLLLGFFLLKRRKLRILCLGSAILCFVVFTNGLLVDYVRAKEAGVYGKARLQEGKKYRVAIVMGGFASMNEETGQIRYNEDRADRLWESIRLLRMGRVERILITGDGTSFLHDRGKCTAELFLTYMEQMGIPRDSFLLEQRARNTRENAVNTAKLLAEADIKDSECLLITSATHMKRSLGCFAKVGMSPDYFSVNIYDLPSEINHRSFYPSWEAAIKWQEILNEWVGDVAYKMKGYI